MKLFLGEYGEPEAMLEHVLGRRHEAEQLKAELLAIEARTPKTEQDRYPTLTRCYGLE